MNKICYVAKPQGWESPKGVVMRTALHNGYRSVAFMCTALEVPCSGDALDLLTEQSSLINKLAMATPDIAQSLLANTYTVKNTDTALWIIDEITLDQSQFAHHFMYCPECLRDELITVFQDIQGLPVCPLHRTQIVTKCPDCHVHEHWTTANLLFCKCGSDRRNTKCQTGILLEEERLETFGPDTYIRQLSHITHISQICDDIWHSRKPNGERKSCFFLDAVREHTSKMITTQVAKYPGFTRSMHLSPWVSSHPLLATLADDIIEERSTFSANCLTGLCCANVKLTMSEIIYSVGDWKEWPKERTFISKNFQIDHRSTGVRYYHCYTPICRLISFVHDRKLHLKSGKKISEFNYLSTPEAGKLLHCSSGTVLQLAELGYLQRSCRNKKSGSGHRALISKLSVKNFNNTYILVGKISHLLKTTPVKTVRLLNQLGIASDHDKLGPYVYEQYIIHTAWEKLEKALANPSPLCPIALPPTQGVQNTFRIANANKAATEEAIPPQPTFIEKPITEDNKCRYTTNQAATLLNISGRLLYYRFVLTGLIKPEIIEGSPYYSLAHIQAMSTHVQQHVSIEQATRILQCGRNKTDRLINLFKLQPSCVLVYSNGDRQLLYNKNDIYGLSVRSATKKRGSLKGKHSSREHASNSR